MITTMSTLTHHLHNCDPRSKSLSFDSCPEASTWAEESARALWELGGSREAKLIRKAFSKTSSLLHAALYWRPRINLANSRRGENRLAFNDMNMVLFEWMENVLCQDVRDNTFVSGPRDSGKTIMAVEMAPVYGGLPALTNNEYVALRQAGVLDSWDPDTIESLMTMWCPYTLIISGTAVQAERHLGKTYDYLSNRYCLLQWDWPTMCRMATYGQTGKKKATSASALEFASGLRLEAFGITAGMLGSRHISARPSLAIVDDLEPGQKWTEENANERYRIVRDLVMPMARNLRLMLIASPQTENSIADRLVRHGRGLLEDSHFAIQSERNSWVHEWDIHVVEPWRKGHSPEDQDVSVQTFWDGYLDADFLKLEREKTTWAVSYNSEPNSEEQVWWIRNLFTRVPLPARDRFQIVLCYIDRQQKEGFGGAAKSRAAYAFVGWVWEQPFYVLGGGSSIHVHRAFVREVMHDMRISGLPFNGLVYEDNAVGDAMRYDFRDEGLAEEFGFDAIGFPESANKEVRARNLITLYQGRELTRNESLDEIHSDKQHLFLPRVVHAETPQIIAIEDGLMRYKGGKKNSDVVDAVGGGVHLLSVLRNEALARRNSGMRLNARNVPMIQQGSRSYGGVAVR